MGEDEIMGVWYWFELLRRKKRKKIKEVEKGSVLEKIRGRRGQTNRKKIVQRIDEAILTLDMTLKDLKDISATSRSLLETEEESEVFKCIDIEENIDDYDPIEELGDYDISKYLAGHEFQFY